MLARVYFYIPKLTSLIYEIYDDDYMMMMITMMMKMMTMIVSTTLPNDTGNCHPGAQETGARYIWAGREYG